MRVALYLRRSTNEELQADSLRAQMEYLQKYAAEEGHEVVAVYEDSGSGRTTAERPKFREMIACVKAGAPFEAILVQNVSRWGRFENTDEAAFYEFLCLSHGVRVVYIQEPFGGDDSPVGVLLKSTKRWMAAEFSREKSKTVQRTQGRVVTRGFMHGGCPPYGLKRTLVTLDGTYLQDLRPGERKVLSTTRIKLAPGDPEQVRVVQRIFREYVTDGCTLASIGSDLNREGIRSTHGGRWSPSRIAWILQNEAYAGTARYTLRTGASREELRDIADQPQHQRHLRRPASFPSIIDPEVWRAAQERLRKSTWRKSNLDLSTELRLAFERWGHVAEPMLQSVDQSSNWETYVKRFRRGYVEALETVFVDEIARAKASLHDVLSPKFVIRDFEGGWLVDDLLHVGFKFAWPRARRQGLQWEFKFDKNDLEDITVGFGFSPPPKVEAVEIFFLQTSWFAEEEQTVGRKLLAVNAPQRFVQSQSAEHTVRYFENAILFRNKRAERRLLDAVKDKPLVTITRLAAELGWPENATRVIYRKLDARGIPVPPLKIKQGRRIEVVCAVCRGVRRLQPSVALALRSEVCFECQHKRASNRLLVTCPNCGSERHVFPSVFRSLKDGAASLCNSCALAAGRRAKVDLREKRIGIEAEKRAALIAVVDPFLRLARERREFAYISRWRGVYPTFHLRERGSRRRLRLTLWCKDENIRAIRATVTESTFLQAAFDRQRWIPIRSDARHHEAWVVTLNPSAGSTVGEASFCDADDARVVEGFPFRRPVRDETALRSK